MLKMKYYIGRIILAGLFCLMAGAAPIFAAEDSALIAVVLSDDIEPYNAAAKGFKNYFVQHKADVHTVNYVLKGQKEDELSGAINKILANKQNLIFTLGTYATKAMQQSAKNISVVFAMVLIPQKAGVLPPGVVMDIPWAVKFDYLKKILPSVKKIGVIYSADSVSLFKDMAAAGLDSGFQVVGKMLDQGGNFPGAFEEIAPQIDCFFMVADSAIFFPKSVEYLLRASYDKKIPVVGLSSNYVKAGALVSFDCDFEDLGSQAGELALKIMEEGASLRTLFVTPRKVKFALNLKVADMIGAKIPESAVQEAGEVFGK